MKVERVEVFPHARNPLGDYAVIKLIGINRLSGPATFQIDTAEPADEQDANWPTGERKPLGVRAGTNRVELLIGPDIVKSAALKPGVRVRFRAPSADVDMELQWPDLTVAGQTSNTTSSQAATGVRQRASAHQTATTRIDKNSAIAGAAGQRNPAEPSLSRLKKRNTQLANASAISYGSGVKPARSDATVSKPAVTPSAITAVSGYRQRVEAERAAEQQIGSDNRSTILVPGLLGFVIVAALFATFIKTTTIDNSGTTLYTALSSPVRPLDTVSRPNTVLAEILEAGSISPSGADASGVSQREALERANDLLATAKNAKDRAEAAFWLRKALSRSLSEPRLVWAITQLGTAYASSDKNTKPNYAAARLLWSWAADAGDAQAACFLGRLYERGLGTPPNPKLALDYYNRARRLGGCPGLEQAMLRVRN